MADTTPLKALDSKLRVVIVGAGFCGLTAAIECKLRGMHPILVEAYSGGAPSHGDILDFTANAGRIFKAWDNGRVARDIWQLGVTNATVMEFYNQDNALLQLAEWPHGDQVFAGHRGTMHQIVLEYAIEIGVEMQFGKRVELYLDDSDGKTGVKIVGGQEILGDVILACDGPRSLARSQLLHLPDHKVNSGYAIFRAFFTIDTEFHKDPVLKSLLKSDEDAVRLWVGPDIHGFIYVWNKGRDCAWVLTHLDKADIGESWSFPASKQDIHAYLDAAGFPLEWHKIVDFSPADRIIDYKLVWRDPLQTWLSPSKRAAVIGDAAHCHLPTSAQGACMAVEDAVVAAMCLQKGKGDVSLALQVFERVRFNRSHVIHQASISTRDIYHKNEWTPESVQENPDALAIPILDWVTEFDARGDVEDNFDRLVEDVRSGKEGAIEHLALPAGGDYSSMALK